MKSPRDGAAAAPAAETDTDDNPSEDVRAQEDEKETDPMETLTRERDEAENKAQENYDRVLRISADFENYKKRSARENKEFKKYANETLIKELLPVIDNLERALESSAKEDSADHAVIQGVSMTLSEILNTFKRFNISQIDALETPFDPAYHQAVVTEETDEFPENTVVKVLQKGYLMHDRLIRPCMVVVAAPKTDN